MIYELAGDSAARFAAARRYDVCVIGAGAAGITLAAELARQGRRVLLVEAGGRAVPEGVPDAFLSEISGEPRHQGAHSGRVCGLGGTTTRWGGQILELNARDFEERWWVSGSGWPITLNDLRPYYGRALRSEGLQGVRRDDADVWRTLRVDPPDLGPSIEAYFTRWCPEPDFAKLCSRVLASSENIDVLLRLRALSLDIQGSRVVGLRVRDAAGAQFSLAADTFVFCMGTIECCRFFLQQHPMQRLPWTDHPKLGSGFQDHIDADTALVHPIDRGRLHAIFDNAYSDGYKYQPKLRLSGAAEERLRCLAVAGSLLFVADRQVSADLKRAALSLRRGKLDRSALITLPTAATQISEVVRQSVRYLTARRAYNMRAHTMVLRAHCEQGPRSANRITLSTERDEHGVQRSHISWGVSDEEIRSALAFTRVVGDELLRSGIARLSPLPHAADVNPGGRCRDSNHHMSGMRMSSCRSDGLVDPNLKLHDVDNVYVCSAAVFPTSGSSNPTHTIIALAHRLADRIVSITSPLSVSTPGPRSAGAAQ